MKDRIAGARNDEGTIMLLTLGFAVVALALVLVVTAATQVHLQRMRLARVADELALDAADALDVRAYYEGTESSPGEVRLAQEVLHGLARDRLSVAAERAGLPPTMLVEASSSDGHTATVTVTTVVHPLFGVDALLPFAEGIPLTATSSARGS